MAADLEVLCDGCGVATAWNDVRALVGFSGSVTYVCDRCRGRA